MTTLLVTDLKGVETSVEGTTGMTLMEVIRGAGFDDMLATCGGSCSCATCQVYVDPEFADRMRPMTVDERELLEGSSFCKPESRLSCQIQCDPSLAGLKLAIAPAD